MNHAILRRVGVTVCAAAWLLLAGRSAIAAGELPDIGYSAGTVVSASDEQKIGRMIMRQLRSSGELVTDPEITEYLQALGQQLSLHAHDGNLDFTFFGIDDPRLNAFALPGGFVGVHTGLLLATETESELAAVLGHEVAHVSQRHLARSAEASGQNGLISTAAMVAAVLVGAAAGASGDAIMAAVSVAQGSAAQSRINFTRANEYEADRVGIRFLADAGFDPMAMPAFFETMSRRSGAAGSQVPEFFRTHPVTSNRIAESRERALKMGNRRVASSKRYFLAKARAEVLGYESAVVAVNRYESRMGGHPSEAPDATQYGYSLALMRAGEPKRAVPLMENLLARDEETVAYHTLTAQVNLAAGNRERAMALFEEGYRLFPRNVAQTMAYSNALMEVKDPDRAHEVMLDLVNNVSYNEDQIRLLALAASAEGDDANAHYYMSEFHVLRGELFMAVDQLKLALASPRIHDYQIARAEARMEQIREYLPKRRPKPRPSQQQRNGRR
ncbi:MAG: M48 family metalloprotease [Gammaproteobacteria bacterium]